MYFPFQFIAIHLVEMQTPFALSNNKMNEFILFHFQDKLGSQGNCHHDTILQNIRIIYIVYFEKGISLLENKLNMRSNY